MKEERKIKMTITKEQETTVEMTLMDYLLDMEDFIQGKKTLNVMNVRRPKAALVKILQADLDDFKQNGLSLIKESASDKIRGLGSSPRLKKYRKNRALNGVLV